MPKIVLTNSTKIFNEIKNKVDANENKRDRDHEAVTSSLKAVEDRLSHLEVQPTWSETAQKELGPALGAIGYQMRVNANDLFSDDPLKQSIASLNIVSAAATGMESIKALGSILSEVPVLGILGGVISLISGILSLVQAAKGIQPPSEEQIMTKVVEKAFLQFTNDQINEHKQDALKAIAEHYAMMDNTLNYYSSEPKGDHSQSFDETKAFLDKEYFRDGHEFFSAVEYQLKKARENFEKTILVQDRERSFEVVKLEASYYAEQLASYTYVASKRMESVEKCRMLSLCFDDLELKRLNMMKARKVQIAEQRQALQQTTDQGHSFLIFQRPDFHLSVAEVGRVKAFFQQLGVEWVPARFGISPSESWNTLVSDNRGLPKLGRGRAENPTLPTDVWTLERSSDGMYIVDYRGQYLQYNEQQKNFQLGASPKHSFTILPQKLPDNASPAENAVISNAVIAFPSRDESGKKGWRFLVGSDQGSLQHSHFHTTLSHDDHQWTLNAGVERVNLMDHVNFTLCNEKTSGYLTGDGLRPTVTSKPSGSRWVFVPVPGESGWYFIMDVMRSRAIVAGDHYDGHVYFQDPGHRDNAKWCVLQYVTGNVALLDKKHNCRLILHSNGRDLQHLNDTNQYPRDMWQVGSPQNDQNGAKYPPFYQKPEAPKAKPAATVTRELAFGGDDGIFESRRSVYGELSMAFAAVAEESPDVKDEDQGSASGSSTAASSWDGVVKVTSLKKKLRKWLPTRFFRNKSKKDATTIS